MRFSPSLSLGKPWVRENRGQLVSAEKQVMTLAVGHERLGCHNPECSRN